MSERLTHLDESGRARMVDVSGKPATAREARACGRVRMKPETLARALAGDASASMIHERCCVSTWTIWSTSTTWTETGMVVPSTVSGCSVAKCFSDV